MNSNNDDIQGKEIGTVHVSMYKESLTGLSFFTINSDNEDVSQIADIIEDTLYDY